MKYLLSLSLVVFLSCRSQELNIPDPNFKEALLTSDCVDRDGDGKGDSHADLNNDGVLQLAELQNITYLNVANSDIESLVGIEYFMNLEKLYCHDNRLSALDVSKNLKLTSLYCYDNQIAALDLKANVELKQLGLRDNEVTVLDLSKNTKLEVLYCYQNRLTSLHINNGNNANMRSMWSYDNPDLKSIKVDDPNAEYPSCDKEDYRGWCWDDETVFEGN